MLRRRGLENTHEETRSSCCMKIQEGSHRICSPAWSTGNSSVDTPIANGRKEKTSPPERHPRVQCARDGSTGASRTPVPQPADAHELRGDAQRGHQLPVSQGRHSTYNHDPMEVGSMAGKGREDREAGQRREVRRLLFELQMWKMGPWVDGLLKTRAKGRTSTTRTKAKARTPTLWSQEKTGTSLNGRICSSSQLSRRRQQDPWGFAVLKQRPAQAPRGAVGADRDDHGLWQRSIGMP